MRLIPTIRWATFIFVAASLSYLTFSAPKAVQGQTVVDPKGEGGPKSAPGAPAPTPTPPPPPEKEQGCGC